MYMYLPDRASMNYQLFVQLPCTQIEYLNPAPCVSNGNQIFVDLPVLVGNGRTHSDGQWIGSEAIIDASQNQLGF